MKNKENFFIFQNNYCEIYYLILIFKKKTKKAINCFNVFAPIRGF